MCSFHLVASSVNCHVHCTKSPRRSRRQSSDESKTGLAISPFGPPLPSGDHRRSWGPKGTGYFPSLCFFNYSVLFLSLCVTRQAARPTVEVCKAKNLEGVESIYTYESLTVSGSPNASVVWLWAESLSSVCLNRSNSWVSNTLQAFWLCRFWFLCSIACTIQLT